MTLEQAQAEYIKLLEKACGSMTAICAVHGIYASEDDIKDGERLRSLIADLQDEKKPPMI